jgi:hypothetical protein
VAAVIQVGRHWYGSAKEIAEQIGVTEDCVYQWGQRDLVTRTRVGRATRYQLHECAVRKRAADDSTRGRRRSDQAA